MLKQLNEYGKFIEITGFRDIKIEVVKTFVKTICEEIPQGVEVQLFDASIVASWEHLYFAAINACAAFKTGRSISKSLAIETALYASSRRQIKKALEFIGIKPGIHNVALLVLGEDAASVNCVVSLVAKRLKSLPDETVLELTRGKRTIIRSAFNISDVELESVLTRDTDKALVNLIVEQTALLSTNI